MHEQSVLIPFFPLAQIGGSAASAPAPGASQPVTPASAPVAAGSAPASNVATTSGPAPEVNALPAVTGLEVKAASTSEMTLTWNDVPGETGFKVFRYVDKDHPPTEVATLQAHTLTFSDKGLSAGTQYGYRVDALNGATTVAQSSDPKTPVVGATSSSFLSSYGNILIIVVMIAGLYFFLVRGQKKEEKKRKGMISEMKKGDRVMTIGGLVARVVSIDGDEVVLKIDESANVKATYRKTAIQEVLDRDEKK